MNLIFLLIGSMAVSWLFINTDWLHILKYKILNYMFKCKKIPWFLEKILTCLKCATVYITFFIFQYYGYALDIALFSAAISSLFVTLIDGYIKIRL